MAYDLVSGRVAGAQNGAHTAVTLGQPGIGDGNTAPSFDGATSYTDVYSATLATAFNVSEGSVIVWLRVSAVGIWSNGLNQRIFRAFVNVNNFVQIACPAVVNRIGLTYAAGGTLLTTNVDGLTSTAWLMFGLTWSVSADEAKAYYNGVQSGATLNGLGVWVGALDNTATLLGATTTTPTGVWDGWLAHCALFDRALAPAEIAALAAVE
ncbi:MAG: hypothetical protein ACYSWU_02070 [Planctomycetota bacterium]